MLRLSVFAVWAFAALAGCSHMTKTLLDPEPPKVVVESVHVKSIGLAGLALSMAVLLENPNHFDIKGRQFTYQASALDQKLAEGKLSEGVELPSLGKTKVTLPVLVSPGAAFRVLSKVISKGQGVTLHLTGSGVFETPLGEVELDFQDEKDIQH